MRTEHKSYECGNPNLFSDVLTPAVEKRIPAKGTIAGRVLDHTTGIGNFFRTVSSDLCDDGKMSSESGRGAVKFITRTATSAVVIGGTASLAALGLVVGSPIAAIGAGAVGLAVLPPLAERAALGIANFGHEILEGIRQRRPY
ncbi:MAG: hypothetical protein ACK5Y6_04855 [Pseudomonadota bacterium]|jgi:hypothetical protein